MTRALAAIREVGIPRLLIALFLAALFAVALATRMNLPILITDSITRIARNGVLVLALLLAIVWLCAGIAALVIAFQDRRVLLGFLGLFAIVYAMLWFRVFARARLVRLSELALPWRIR